MDDLKDSQIRNFYAGKTIFLTDGTGFAGKCIVEKLLRACPKIKKIYVLIDPKNNTSLNEYMKSYFENAVFDTVRQTRPSFETIVTGVFADLSKPRVGLSMADHYLITQEAEIIIHNNSTEILNEDLTENLTINVLGTKKVLELASECQHIQCFVYVSNAFAQCNKTYIEEKFYMPPGDLKMVEDMMKAQKDNAVGLTKESIKLALGDWPNIHVFSKAIAEGFVHDYSKRVQFPCIVYRPSFVTSTYKEPIEGWIEDSNTALMVSQYVALGYIHARHAKDNTFDIIPADMSTNALLAVIWHTMVNRKDLKGGCVYNYCSGTVNPISYKQIVNSVVSDDVPPLKAVWYHSLVLTGCYYWFLILHFFLNMLPAFLCDVLCHLQGKSAEASCTVCKLNRQLGIYSQFSLKEWRFDMSEMRKIWEAMNAADQTTFYCDLRTLKWKDYLSNAWIGMRTLLLKDPIDTAEAARCRYQKLKITHYVVKILFILTILYNLIY